MRAMNQEFTLGEVQKPPSVGSRTVLCIALTTCRMVSFCRIGLNIAVEELTKGRGLMSPAQADQ